MSLDAAEALFDDEKHVEAREVAEKALKADDGIDAATSKQLTLLIRKCNLHAPPKETAPAEKPAEQSKVEQPAAVPTAAAAAPSSAPAKPAPLARHEWYQTASHIIFTFYVKGRAAADVKVSAKPRSLSVTIKMPNSEQEAQWLFEPFFMNIDPNSVETTCTPYKVEMKLAKATPSQWASLELKAGADVAAAAPASIVASLPKTHQELSYPNSSAKRTDWSKVTLGEQDDGAQKSGDEALSALFKKIYGNADEDTRRAMMKSYAESGGTTLSTNWKDVGSRYVAPSAPTGMQVVHNTTEAEKLTQEALKNKKPDDHM